MEYKTIDKIRMLGLGIDLDSMHSGFLSLSSETSVRQLNCQEQIDEWANKLRDFSDRNKEKCCILQDHKVGFDNHEQTFITNSKYKGQRDVFGMCGHGTYTFPNGVKYIGGFKNDLFHGYGYLQYPDDDAIMEGSWYLGLMTEPRLFLYKDFLYDFDNWAYCEIPDRRFKIEHDTIIQPPDKSYLTNTQPTREIPDGYYDTEDGFYNPHTQFIYEYDNLSQIVRKTTIAEHKWIKENCRYSEQKPLGPRNDLYERFPRVQQGPEEHQGKRGFSIASSHNIKYLERWQAMRQAMDINHMRSKMVHQRKSGAKIEDD